MAQEKEIILSVDVGQAESRLAVVQKQITDLTTAQKELNKQYKAGAVSAEDYAVANETFSKGLSLLKGEYKTLTAEATKNVSVNASLGNSYNEISARLAQAQKQYKALSSAQRESAEGKELLKNIADQKQALKDIDATMGDFQRNVGNYPKAFDTAFSKIDGILANFGTNLQGLATGGFGAVKAAIAATGAQLVAFGKLLLTTPLGLIVGALAALVAMLTKVAGAIKKNDDAGTAFAKLFASFEPILDAISRGLEKVAVFFGKVADSIADFIGGFSDSAKEAQNLVTSIDNLEERERQFVLSSAENNKKISELRAQVAEKDKYTADERRKALEDAIALEKENLTEQVAIAKERLRIAEEENRKNADTSDEAKNREVELRRAVIEAETNYNNKMREYAAQRVEINNQIKEDAKTRNDEERKQAEERLRIQAEERSKQEQLLKEQREVELSIAIELQDQLLANMKDGADKRIAETQLSYGREIEALQNRLETEKNLTEQAREGIKQLIIAKQQAMYAEIDAIEAEREAQQEQAILERNERINAIYAEIDAINRENQLSQDELAIEEEQLKHEDEMARLRARLADKSNIEQGEADALNSLLEAKETAHIQKIEEMKRKAQANAILQATQNATTVVNSFGSVLDGVSALMKAFGADEEEQARLSKAIALGKIAVQTGIAIAEGTAQAMSVPFPANIAAIATTVGTVLANIATAIATVNGAKFATGGVVAGTSYTGDNIGVRVNSGEMILTREQQGRLFEMANVGGVDNSALVDALVNAISTLPAPVLVYDEFRDFQERVVRFDDLTK